MAKYDITNDRKTEFLNFNRLVFVFSRPSVLDSGNYSFV
jgi:hypothetical protein